MQTDVTRNIAARPPAIFAVVSDIAHWPQIFGAVRNIEPLTDGPVSRTGTRLRDALTTSPSHENLRQVDDSR